MKLVSMAGSSCYSPKSRSCWCARVGKVARRLHSGKTFYAKDRATSGRRVVERRRSVPLCSFKTEHNTTPGLDGEATSHARNPCARLGNGARKPVRAEFGSQMLWCHDCAQRGVAYRRSWRGHWTKGLSRNKCIIISSELIRWS